MRADSCCVGVKGGKRVKEEEEEWRRREELLDITLWHE